MSATTSSCGTEGTAARAAADVAAAAAAGEPLRSGRAARWVDLIRRPAAARNTTAIVALLAALWAAGSFVVPVVMSVLLAVLLWPVLAFVRRWLRVRALAALVVTVAATAVTGGMMVAVASQLTVAVERLPDVLHYAARDVSAMAPPGGGRGTWERTKSALEELDRSVARATGTQRGSDTAQRQKSASIVHATVEWISATAVAFAKALANSMLQAGVIILLTFFLLCTGDKLAHGLSVWCDGRPLARGRFSPLVCDTAREMRHFGAVTMIVNLVIAAAAAVVFFAFGVDNAVLWGAVGGALHFIPYAGLAVLMVLALIEVYAAQASLVAALLAMGCIGLIGMCIGSGLAAWLQGKASSVDGAVMFAGTVFFSVLWGGWGLVLGPMLVVALHVVMRHAAAQSAAIAAAEAAARAPVVPVDNAPSIIVSTDLAPDEVVKPEPAAVPIQPPPVLVVPPTSSSPVGPTAAIARAT